MSFAPVLSRRGDALFVEDVSVSELAERYDTPLYVYSRAALRERVKRLQSALGDTPHVLAYAIKANMNLAVVRTFLDEGCGVDVTSGGELARALRAGAEPDQVVYSGVGKRADEIDRALAAGIRMFNVESTDELAEIDARARARDTVAPIAFRLNPNVDPQTHPNISTGLRTAKFGIPIEDAPAAYAHAKTLANVRAIGVDCHIGSQLLRLAPLRDALLLVKQAVLDLRGAGHAIELIDVGGGLGVSYADGEEPPAPEAYAEMVLETVGGLDATLVLEPGRFLTANAGVLVTRVLYRKDNEDKRFVVVDGAMNDYLRPALYGSVPRFEVDPLRPGASATADVVGPVCESTDRFLRDAALPPLQNGDLFVLRDVGAYGFAMASAYNGRPLAAEVMVSGRRAELVRSRQSIDDTWRGERVPDWDEA